MEGLGRDLAPSASLGPPALLPSELLASSGRTMPSPVDRLVPAFANTLSVVDEEGGAGGGGGGGGGGGRAHRGGTGRCPRSPFRIKWSTRRRRPRRRRRRRRRRRAQAANGHGGSRIKDPARGRERRRGRLGEGGQGEAKILRRRCHCRRRAGSGVAVATGTNRARVQTHTAHGNGEIFLHTIYLLLLEVGGPTPRSAQTRAARQHRAPRQGASADVPMGSAGREGK
jgi:hypothetical protein